MVSACSCMFTFSKRSSRAHLCLPPLRKGEDETPSMMVEVREEEGATMEAHSSASGGGGGRKGRKKKRGGLEEDWSGDLEAIAVEAGMDVGEEEREEDGSKVEDPIAQGEVGRGGGRKGRKSKKKDKDW